MELFPDGSHVRLRSHVYGTYLHADEDGVGVSLNPLRASLNAAWRVHRIVRNDIALLLLYGAAYGRYLAATHDRAPGGHRVVQGVYDDPEGVAVVWCPVRLAPGEDRILLQQVSDLRLLRANGKYFKWRRTCVSVDSYYNRSPMMHCVVEAIPPLPAPPIFAPPDPVPALVPPRRGLFRKRTPVPERRTIRYVRADANGNFNDQDWGTFRFHARNAYNLRMQLTRQNSQHFFFFYMTVCARPGRYARLTPLIADLPRSNEPMDVVAVTNGTPVEVELRYPDIDAA